MIFGYIDYVITGDSFTKFFRRIMSKKLPVSKMCEKNGKLTLRMPAEHCKALERLCNELGLEYTATKRHGSFVLAKRFFGRGGLVIGTAAVMLSCFYLSNVVVRFDILSDDENIRKLLEENPEEFYHQGSEMFKQQIFEEKILKIMKLIFVQMYQIDEVKEFFLREILGGSTDFWSDVFGILIQKNVIGSDCNPNKLAEMYFGFSMFKLWEIFLKYDDFPKAEIEIMFDEVEEYHKFLLDSVRADKNE